MVVPIWPNSSFYSVFWPDGQHFAGFVLHQDIVQPYFLVGPLVTGGGMRCSLILFGFLVFLFTIYIHLFPIIILLLILLILLQLLRRLLPNRACFCCPRRQGDRGDLDGRHGALRGAGCRGLLPESGRHRALPAAWP